MTGTNHVGGNYRGTDEAAAQDAFTLSLIEEAVKQEAEQRRREIANAAEDGAQ